MDQLRPESRIAAQEKQTGFLAARIEELATDTDNSFSALKQEMKDGFLEMGKAFDLNAGNIEEVKQRLSKIEATQEQILRILQGKQSE